MYSENALIAVTEEDRKTKCFVRVEDLDIPEQTVVRGWLKGYKDEVLVVLPESLQTKTEAQVDCIWCAAT
jgi:hypothetical protein